MKWCEYTCWYNGTYCCVVEGVCSLFHVFKVCLNYWRVPGRHLHAYSGSSTPTYPSSASSPKYIRENYEILEWCWSHGSSSLSVEGELQLEASELFHHEPGQTLLYASPEMTWLSQDEKRLSHIQKVKYCRVSEYPRARAHMDGIERDTLSWKFIQYNYLLIIARPLTLQDVHCHKCYAKKQIISIVILMEISSAIMTTTMFDISEYSFSIIFIISLANILKSSSIQCI